MADRMSVADALAIQALPEAMRVQLLGMIRTAAERAYDEAVTICDDDREHRMEWRHLADVRSAVVWSIVDEGPEEILGVPNPINFDEMLFGQGPRP